MKQRRPSAYEINKQAEKRIKELSNAVDGTGALSVYNLSSIVMMPLDFRNRDDRENSGDLSPGSTPTTVATVVANPLKTLRRMSSFGNSPRSPRRTSNRSLGNGDGSNSSGGGGLTAVDVTVADVYELTGTSPPSHASYLIDLVDQAEKSAILQSQLKNLTQQQNNEDGVLDTTSSHLSQYGDSGGEVGDMNASSLEEKETQIGDTGGTSAPQTNSLQNSISSLSPPQYSSRLGGDAAGSMSLSPTSFSQHLHGGGYDPSKRGGSFAETDVSNPFYVPYQLPPATYRGRAATGIQNADKAQDRATRVRMLGQ